MPEREYGAAEIDAAIEKLSQPGRLAAAETHVSRSAPQLQRILNDILQAGGFFDQAHESQVLKAATTPGDDERIAAVRTLVAETMRTGMLIGVAVGWQLAEELRQGD